MKRKNYPPQSSLLRFIASVLFLAVSTLSWAYDAKLGNNYYNFSGSEAEITYKDTDYNSYSGSVIIPSTVTYSGKTYTVTKIGDEIE